jgi:hypothetical protein
MTVTSALDVRDREEPWQWWHKQNVACRIFEPFVVTPICGATEQEAL